MLKNYKVQAANFHYNDSAFSPLCGEQQFPYLEFEISLVKQSFLYVGLVDWENFALTSTSLFGDKNPEVRSNCCINSNLCSILLGWGREELCNKHWSLSKKRSVWRYANKISFTFVEYTMPSKTFSLPLNRCETSLQNQS